MVRKDSQQDQSGLVNVEVRICRLDEIDTTVEIYLAANDARRGGRATPTHHFERVRRNLNSPDAIRLLAEDSGLGIGMALALPSRDNGGLGEPIPGECFISMVFVVPERWGEGIGSALTTAVVDEARAWGFSAAQLWTHGDNHRSQRLYERLGSQRSGHERVDDLGDRIIQYQWDL